MSAMKMENNSRQSCGEKPRHKPIRYFFIKDVPNIDSIEVIDWHTKRIIADYFTKPLQGSIFRNVRDIIMGLAPLQIKKSVAENEINATRNKSSVTCSCADMVYTKKVIIRTRPGVGGLAPETKIVG